MNFQNPRTKQFIWIILGLAFLMSLNNPFLIIIFGLLGMFFYKNFIINKNQMNSYNNFDLSRFVGNVKKGGIFLIIVILLIILLPLSIVVIDAGETGVYSLFGKVRDQELSSGLHFKNPFAKVTKLTTRTEEYTMSGVTSEGKVKGMDAISALTKEGLEVTLDITVLYRLDQEKASDIYREMGLNYEDKIIRPIIRSSIRGVIAQYDAKVIYSEKRSEIGDKISIDLDSQLTNRGIIMEEFLLRNVVLPMNLQKSIEEKLQAEQESEKMDFVLTKETKEKERKIIEAEGQRESQTIINQSLTPSYLNYLYIKNLQDREGTIYVPIGENGMPLFKNIQ